MNIFNLEKPNGEIETNSEKFYIYGNTGVFDNDDQTLLNLINSIFNTFFLFIIKSTFVPR